MSETEKVAKIFPCSQSETLAKAIAESYGIPLGKIDRLNFSDGEFQPSFEDDQEITMEISVHAEGVPFIILNSNTFIFQSFCESIAINLSSIILTLSKRF